MPWCTLHINEHKRIFCSKQIYKNVLNDSLHCTYFIYWDVEKSLDFSTARKKFANKKCEKGTYCIEFDLCSLHCKTRLGIRSFIFPISRGGKKWSEVLLMQLPNISFVFDESCWMQLDVIYKRSDVRSEIKYSSAKQLFLHRFTAIQYDTSTVNRVIICASRYNVHDIHRFDVRHKCKL